MLSKARVWLMTAVLSSVPALALAQGGLPDKIVPCSGVDCTFCDLAQLAQNILNTGIFVAVFLSAVLFAYAGWLYLSNEALGEQMRARAMFQNVAFGLAIILGAWLFVDTLMKTLLGGSYLPWNSVCR